MKYVYWAVQCKTQGCPQVHYAKEIGESTKHPLTHYILLSENLPSEFHYQCGKCGTTHSYTPADMVAVESPRLSGLQQWW